MKDYKINNEDDFIKMLLMSLDNQKVANAFQNMINNIEINKNDELNNAKNQIKKLNQEIMKINDDNAELKKENMNLNNNLSFEKNEYEKFKYENSSLQKKIQELSDDLHRLAMISEEKKRTLDLEINKNYILENKLKTSEEKNKALDLEINKNFALNNKLKTVEEKSMNLEEKFNKYRLIDFYYEKYKSLGESISNGLINVINGKNAELFLCSGVQFSNLEPLWEFISYRLNVLGKKEIEDLFEMLLFTVQCH